MRDTDYKIAKEKSENYKRHAENKESFQLARQIKKRHHQ